MRPGAPSRRENAFSPLVPCVRVACVISAPYATISQVFRIGIRNDASDIAKRVKNDLLELVSTLQRVGGSAIPRFLGYILDPTGTFPRKLLFDCHDYSLLAYLKRPTTRISLALVGILFRELSEALCAFQNAGIAHGDLHPEAVLVYLKAGQPTLRIAGLGYPQWAQSCYARGEARFYSARDPVVTVQSDVFSVGIILCEIVMMFLSQRNEVAVNVRYQYGLARRAALIEDATQELHGYSSTLGKLLQWCCMPSSTQRISPFELREQASRVTGLSPAQLFLNPRNVSGKLSLAFPVFMAHFVMNAKKTMRTAARARPRACRAVLKFA